ncbi:MAG: SRPBCC family protein, partial [Actinobacteria bacterium]|nr:SRPBCC family protein [Actinomycetota bacterium]
MTTGSASVIINRTPAEVFAVVSDITRTGEWSPECISGRWVDGATGPAVGAKFEGDNKVVVAGIPMKKWTTTSEVTACTPGEVFEFVAEGYTTWRYELEPTGT